MEKYILDIDARVGKRGKREVMRFAGSLNADEIEAYKTEMQMTKADMEASKESASASAAAAATSAEEAASSDKSAKTSADAARDSASSALQSATGAEGSATAAANSATAAGKSASDANLSVLQAGTFADNASTSAEEAAASATAAAKSAAEAAVGVAGVSTFNGRNGAVMPQIGDYSYDMITGTPPTTTYEVATKTTDGLMSKTDKAKLDGIATGANKTVTDTAVTEESSNPVSSSGIYAAIKAVKDSIVSTVTDAIDTVKTAIGNASASAAGLMSSADKTKLDGIATGATNVSVDADVTEGSSNAASSGGVYTAIKAVKDSIVSTVTTNIATIKTAIGNASTSVAGLMSATDKTKLDGIATGANKTLIANNLTTSTAGSALDATQGKALKALADRLVDCGTQSLTASGGSVTFTNSGITTSSLIDVYTTIPNITYTAVTVAAGSCTLTFDAQDAAFDVRLCIWNL